MNTTIRKKPFPFPWKRWFIGELTPKFKYGQVVEYNGEEHTILLVCKIRKSFFGVGFGRQKYVYSLVRKSTGTMGIVSFYEETAWVKEEEIKPFWTEDTKLGELL